MQLVGPDQLGRLRSYSPSTRHLEFAMNRSTAIQHDGGKVDDALPAFAFR
jgi:hypothetical protein